MPTVSSGPISLSNVSSEFGSSFRTLSNCYAIAPGVPTSSSISLSNLYGKSASMPSITAPSLCNIDTGVSTQSGTWELSNFVSDTYGRPHTYSVPTYNTSHFTSASMTGSRLSYSFPVNRFALSTPVTVMVINRFGRSNPIMPSFFVKGYNMVPYSLGSVSMSNNTVSYFLGSYFADYSGTALGYSIIGNPYNSAWISGSTLFVLGNNRSTSYTVTVMASNSFNQSASTSLSVTETAPAPVTSGWSVSSSDRLIAWQIGGFTYYAIPCYSFSEISQNWQYSLSLNGPWSDFPIGIYVSVPGGVNFNGSIYSGYYRSAAWTTGNPNYFQRVGRQNVFYTTSENTAVNNRIFTGY